MRSVLAGQLTDLAEVVELASAPEAPSISPLELVLVFSAGLLLFFVIRAVRWAFPLLPVARPTRNTLMRVGPAFELGVWMIYLVSAIAWTMQGHPVLRLIALGLLALLLVIATWFLIRDYLSGVVLRTERHLQVGDRIQVGELDGVVKRFSTRVAELELPHGDVVLIPYVALREATIRRRRTKLAAARHSFVVDVPSGVSPTAAREAVRRAALLSHWITPSDEPQIVALDHHTLKVTVHALTDARAGDVEATVREALRDLSAPDGN